MAQLAVQESQTEQITDCTSIQPVNQFGILLVNPNPPAPTHLLKSLCLAVFPCHKETASSVQYAAKPEGEGPHSIAIIAAALQIHQCGS